MDFNPQGVKQQFCLAYKINNFIHFLLSKGDMTFSIDTNPYLANCGCLKGQLQPKSKTDFSNRL